jgi:hypothetical protein
LDVGLTTRRKNRLLRNATKVIGLGVIILHGYETLSLMAREERKLRMFENRVLRRIFGPIKDEVTRGWRKLHNEELHNLCSSTHLIRVIKSKRIGWAGHVVHMARRGMHVGY